MQTDELEKEYKQFLFLLDRKRAIDRRRQFAAVLSIATLGIVTLAIGAGFLPWYAVSSPNYQFVLSSLMALWSGGLGYYIGQLRKPEQRYIFKHDMDLPYLSAARNVVDPLEFEGDLLRKEGELLRREIELERKIAEIFKDLSKSKELNRSRSVR